ncbi:hypothetical protein PV728_01800 [Streptomyces europaeiscabiei]|uniref:hypothetical protein n=1 Tax=Streptomyces europaeiscabiei TaxID=146819 RepID=UPI0029B6707D|nr:hypothetical protein [Streptomyces europaeiscabiei]MDX3629063.1 hypothetical protein [Streptomyces europaeiscabiei]
MPQRRTQKDRERRAALASQAADIWPDPPSPPPVPEEGAEVPTDGAPRATDEEAE